MTSGTPSPTVTPEPVVTELGPDEHGSDTTHLGFPAMRELRPHLSSADEFVARVHAQRRDGYRLLASFDAAGEVAAVLGFRGLRSLSRGHYLYVDDLSTLPTARRQGHAAALLRRVEHEAVRLGCDQIHLDSQHHRHAAHRRYDRSGYADASKHFVKRVGVTPDRDR